MNVQNCYRLFMMPCYLRVKESLYKTPNFPIQHHPSYKILIHQLSKYGHWKEAEMQLSKAHLWKKSNLVDFFQDFLIGERCEELVLYLCREGSGRNKRKNTKENMAYAGLEPATFALLARRSNQLG